MRQFLRLFLLVLLSVAGLASLAHAQSDYPYVQTKDDSLPILGSRMVDPSNHPVTFHIGSFFDVFTEISLDFSGSTRGRPSSMIAFALPGQCSMRGLIGGTTSFYGATCNAEMTLTPNGGVPNEYDTEMLSLSISGGTLPAGVMIRESPTLQSTGKTSVKLSSGGVYMLCYTVNNLEMSTDGGATWTPGDGPVTLQMRVPPKLTTYDPPGPVPSAVAIGDLDRDGYPDIVIGARAPLPSPPLGGSLTSPLDCDVTYKYGGAILRKRIEIDVSSRHTSDNGSTQHFDTEMLNMDLSGGSLPGGVMVRESPSKASLGRTSVRAIGGGANEISSFFDVFTELSIDGGQTWTPQDPFTLDFSTVLSDPPPVGAPDNGFPPAGTVFLDPSDIPVTYPAAPSSPVITDLTLDFGATPPVKPPLPGISQTQDLTGTATFRMSVAGAPFQLRTCPVSATIRTSSSSSSGDTRSFDTEILAMSLSGGTVPGGMMIRESPSKASLGRMAIRESPTEPSRISSFFDVFTELSMDGGVSWIPADVAVHEDMHRPPLVTFTLSPSPMPSGALTPVVHGDPDFDLLRLTHHTEPPIPLPPDGSTITSFLNEGGVVIVLDGVTRSSSDVTCQIRVRGNYSDGEVRHFDTEMLSLDISGGTLPGGVMVRESPSKASLGRTSVRTMPGGGYEVSSFFDVFTELSIDGGQTWTPKAPFSIQYSDTLPSSNPDQDCESDAIFPNDLFPPQPARLVHPPATPPWLYASGASAGNVLMHATSPSVSLPTLGNSQLMNDNEDCDMQISFGSGLPRTDVHMTGHMSSSYFHKTDDGVTRYFDTEMLSLDLQGSGGGQTVRIRESPTLQSTGQTTVRSVTGGWRIHSFFDVFTEISLDDGLTWSPSSNKTTMEYELNVPEGQYASHDFPPRGKYGMVPECSSIKFSNGGEMRIGSFFDIFPEAALPPPGSSSTNASTGHAHMQISLDEGNSFFDVFTEVAMSTHVTATNTTAGGQDYDTEMLSLSLSGSGGGGGAGGMGGVLLIRESPTKVSLGRTQVRESPTRMSSFFDVFLELSVDGGQTWSPATTSMRMELDTVKPGAITGVKWHDANGNGVRDAAETGLANWKIFLTDTLGNIIDTVRTDVAGNYTFPNLVPGTYRVHEETRPGWIQTGGAPAYGFWMVPGDTIGGNDFGNFQAPNLTGVKFNDHNGDGVRDQGDEGIPGWKISIFPKNIPTPGERVNHAAVALSMRLNGLPPVSSDMTGYTVARMGRPSVNTALNNPFSQAKKSSRGALAIEPRSILKTFFETGDIPTEQQFAELRSSVPAPIGGMPLDVTMRIRPRGWDGTIKGRVGSAGSSHYPSFFDVFTEVSFSSPPGALGGPPPPGPFHCDIILEADLDGDGEVDISPVGAIYHGSGGVLLDGQGQPVGTLDNLSMTIGDPASQVSPISTVTDSMGNFSFAPMLPGVWNVVEEKQPCWNQTTANPGPIEVLDGTPIPPVAFGNHLGGGTIAVTKYYDINHSQTLNPGEPPMQGVQFMLNQMGTAQQYSASTDANGMVYFTDLPNGDYDLTEVVPAGYTVSNPKGGHSFFTVSACDTQSVVWLNAAAFTDSTFRTATYEEWAKAVDAKDARKPVKCKPDKVDFKLNLVVPTLATSAVIVEVKFSMPTDIKGVWADGKNKSVPYCYDTTKTIVDAKRQLWRFDLTDICAGTAPTPGQMIQFDGLGQKGSLIKATYAWFNAVPGSKALIKGSLPGKPVTQGDEIKPILRLPMPNLVNVLEELQEQLVFPIVVGGAVGDTHSVFIKGYSDLLKSLAKAQKGGVYILHDSTNLGECLDSLNGKFVKKQIKGLPPEKYQNRLFAEALTLKLNILASRYGKFPVGFDTLIYDYHKIQPGPFDGKSVAEILRQVEAFLSCKPNPKPGATPQDYFFVLRRINEAFSGPIDTVRWSCLKLEMSGVRPLKDVLYMRANPGSFATYLEPLKEGTGMNVLPSEFALKQNYPNPFNPTTNIEFELADASIVTLKIYNTLGQEVKTLLNGAWMEDGSQSVEFDAGNLPSGVYFYRITAQSIGDEEAGILGQQFVSVKKMILVK